MCRHTRELTVLCRVSCRPFHLNVDRFHQPCLLPGRTSRIGEDCRPRTTWRPLTLFGQPRSPSLCVSKGCSKKTRPPRSSCPKITVSYILLDTSFHHRFQSVKIRSHFLLMNLQVVQFQYGLEFLRLSYS